MAAPKKHPRYGGRKAGTPNKKTQELHEAIANSGLDPLQVMLDLLKSNEEHVKLAAAKVLLEYMYPKRKALEQAPQAPDDENTDSKHKLELVSILRERG